MTIEPDSQINVTLKPMTLEAARTINSWVYEPPYAIYSFSGEPEDIDDLLNGQYWAAFGENDELIGFFCTGEAAQVPGARLVGIYDEPGYLDIGLGMRPDLTGKGRGEAFLRQGLASIMETFQATKLRLAVAAFNKRAAEVYRRAGFREDRTFTSMVQLENLPFINMIRDESAGPIEVRKEHTVRLFGTIEDFAGNPLEGAWVCLRNEKFEDLYELQTDRNGRYEMQVQPGIYYTLFACKDYKVNYLEYWAWNLPLFADYELNARTDGLEVYSLSAFPVKRMTRQLMLYFRPMSLKRAKEWEEGSSSVPQDPPSVIDISPKLEKEDIEVQVNGEKCEVHEINRVVEHGGEGRRIYAYLIHVSLPATLNIYEYSRIDVALVDRETLECGEGTLFWKEEKTVASL